ncbi:MAG TPA: hypothetical protein VIK63_06165 [Haloplasmataceae bacterium]
MWHKIRKTIIQVFILPLLIIGYVLMLLVSIVIPPKFSTNLFNIVKLEEKIGEIINKPLNLFIVSLILTLIAYITYRVAQ